jgi:hypothetical protein
MVFGLNFMTIIIVVKLLPICLKLQKSKVGKLLPFYYIFFCIYLRKKKLNWFLLGWTKEETIDSLLRKGGYSGQITERVRSRVILTRYQSVKYVITYDEYLEYTGQKVITTYDNRKSNKSSKQKYLVDRLDLEDLIK